MFEVGKVIGTQLSVLSWVVFPQKQTRDRHLGSGSLFKNDLRECKAGRQDFRAPENALERGERSKSLRLEISPGLNSDGLRGPTGSATMS